MASKCRKFVPNIFNKAKCQTCFGSKEHHSAEALENNKASRKVSKCGYLFVAPGYDFSSPLDRTKRWQRRFFVLYDDGELAYSVDENPDTVPQSVVDMNKCTDVKDASGSTSHTNSLAVITPEKTTYIKGNSKEEIQWWHDVLIVYPRSMIKPKQRRFTVPSYSFLNKENLQPSSMSPPENTESKSRPEVVDKIKIKEQSFSTYRGVRSMKHKGDKHYQEGLRKSSSLHDLSSEEKEISNLESSRFLSRSGDRLNSTDNSDLYTDSARLLAGYNHPYITQPPTGWKTPAMAKQQKSGNQQDASSSNSSVSSHATQASTSSESKTQRRGSLDDKVVPSKQPRTASERAKMHRERSASMKIFPSQHTLPSLPKIPSSVGGSGMDRLLGRPDVAPSSHTNMLSLPGRATLDENETDENKMAKSSEMHVVSRTTPPPPSPTRQTAIPVSPVAKFEEAVSPVPVIVPPEPMIIVTPEPLNHAAPEPIFHVVFTPDPPEREQDLMYMKKGWLIKMGTSEKDWKKHWFVLTGNSLRYYKDAKSEETNQLDGRIDLSSCYEISEVLIQRNYGFKIRTRNGEYILSAMTSGIRSNWMKAIRLCMDLQASNKSSPSGEGGTATPPRTNDDMEVDMASVSSVLTTSADTPKQPGKKEYTRHVRRHYSDVNPGNISKLLSIKALDTTRGLSPSASSQSSESSAVSSKEPSIEREVQPVQKQAPTHIDLGIISKPRKFSSGQEHMWSGDGIPFRRFVEGSDSEVAPVSVPEVTAKVTAGDKQKDDDDKKRRAKSPSAKIKERTRAKSPKLHSPPPGQERDDKFTFRMAPPPERTEVDRLSVSSDDMDVTDGGGDIENMHLDGDENLTSTMSSAGEGMLVDLLENEVDSLKERLEHTEKELVKSHDSNSDLKSKLQSVVREKENMSQPQASIDSSFTNTAPLSQPPDNSQTNAMKRQLKDAKDTVQRQKNEIDGLKSKLDMSVSKLTGTEKALSEALKDVKQEKDKFLKVTTEYNRKVRTLEGQLKDVTSKMEKYHENSLNKDKENRRLDNDLKTHQHRLRDHEREILKLKAVEHEYRQMKEKCDETDRVMSRYRMELSEKDKQLKKIEIEYDEQFEKIMDDFTKERDDTEQHIEDLKCQLIEAQHKMSNNESLSSSMATILSDKDEIIAQLEEKVIESETKMVEMSEEVKENEELSGNIEILEGERDNAVAKIKEVEKLMSHYQNQVTRMEKENVSIRKHMDDLRRENTDLSERLDDEKTDTSSLAKDNDELKSNVKGLEDEVHNLHKKLTDLVSSHDRMSSSSDGTTSQEMLHTFILATSEMNDISDYVLSMRKKVETVLMASKGDQKSSLTSVAEMLEDLGRKCENISEVLKEGSTVSVEPEVEPEKSKALEASNAEIELLKAKNKQAETEVGKLRKEIKTTQSEYEKLQLEDTTLKEKVKTIDEKCKTSIESLSQRVQDLTVKHKIVSDNNIFEGNKASSMDSVETISSVIEGQLSELEDHVDMVEKVLQTQDLSMSSVESEADVDTAMEESESESEESDGYLDSDEDADELDDTQDDVTLADGPENLLRKLKQMKRQLEVTNSRIKGLTSGITAESETSTAEADTGVELELRNTLIRCGEKIDSLTNRLSDGLKSARTEVPRFSDQTWAFQKCVNQLKSKVNAVNKMVHEHDDINAKDLKHIQERMRYLVEYVNQVDKLGDTDWDIAGKIAKQEMKFQHLLANKENATRQSGFKYEDKLQLYADKLSFEAMILGQMAILIQRQQVGGIYKDSLLREIHEANLQILELERRIDSTQRDMNPSVQEKDLVSSYASMLAEKIVLEGQLASCAMVQDIESSEHAEVLSALNISDSPTVLAVEIFLRSQVDSSVNEQLQKFAESLDTVSNHIVTRALLQGEITHALQIVKQKFKKVEHGEDISSLVKRERQYAFDQLAIRHKTILDLLNETEPLAMTTLIQLIEFSQGPGSPTLDSVCDNIGNMLHKKIEEYENSMKTADVQTKRKIEHIISHLHSELEDAISIFREEHQCYVQTASPDIDTNVLKFSADSVSSDLAKMFIQKAVIEGTFTYVSDLYKSSPDIPVSQMMDPLESSGQGLSDLAKSLGQILLTEAANKQSLSGDIRQGTVKEGIASSITDMIGLIPDLEAYPQSYTAYATTLVREAMFQSQLTYTTYKLQLEYHRKLRDIRLKMEAGEKVVLPSEISQEAESDIQASLTIFEEILETKYQDECAVLSLLDCEISKLKSTSSDKSCSSCKTYETNVKQLEKSFQHEVSVAQERQNVHVDVLRQEVNNVILRVDKFLEDYEKEKDTLVNDYEDRIATLQDEFDIMRIDHEEELEQVKQDIMTAVSAIKATEEEADTNSSDQLRNHNHQLMKISSLCKDLLVEIRGNVGGVDRQTQLTQRIDEYMTYMQQIESDPAFILDTPSPPPSHDIAPSTPTIQAEGPPLDRSLSAERSDESVDRVLEKSHHEQEMEQLKKEKEEALADEVKITKAALDAMRKAYEEELEQEKDKYRGALKTMFTDNYVEDIRRRHDIEAERLREELKQVSMHYDSKCEDYKLLEDRLQRTKADFQTHINQLSKSNEKLSELVNTEIGNLKLFITTRTKGSVTGNATLDEELYDAQIMVRVKDAELQKLRSQVKNIENNLERTTEEQRYTMTQYLQTLKKNQELQAKLKQEVTQQRERKDSSQEEQIYKNARALRRNPSFHQRARSPSPDTSPRKEGEHHSRDAHRRSNRHLNAKDLKRSKSSPSLPFVFAAKGSGSITLSTSHNGQPGASTVSRRDSAKLSRSQRK